MTDHELIRRDARTVLAARNNDPLPMADYSAVFRCAEHCLALLEELGEARLRAALTERELAERERDEARQALRRSEAQWNRPTTGN